MHVAAAVVALAMAPMSAAQAAAPVRLSPFAEHLRRLQDSQASGLVPLDPGGTFTTTYVNAVVTIAFVLMGDYERARRILDVFLNAPVECACCACPEGFQQARDAATGDPRPSDWWVGDNAWLLTSVKTYAAKTGDPRYEALVARLKQWLSCLEQATPDPGIIGGYRSPTSPAPCADIPPHPEGSIDVFGALAGLGLDQVRASVKQWLDQNVWVPAPAGACFDRGPGISANLATDQVSWGLLALAPENPAYRCILPYASVLTARANPRHVVEAWDRDDLWFVDRQDPSIQVQLTRPSHVDGHNLEIAYTIPAGLDWFRVYRNDRVDFGVTPAFVYAFEVFAEQAVPQFEVKLSQLGSGYTCIHSLPLNPGWRSKVVRYDQLRDFATGLQCTGLTRVGQVEFAVNYGGQGAANHRIQIGSVRYDDSGKPRMFPVDGFDGFQSEANWLFVEGTAQMAAAYCAADRLEDWRHYLDELRRLARPSFDGAAEALPQELTGALDAPASGPVATAWLIIAAQCFNPFYP